LQDTGKGRERKEKKRKGKEKKAIERERKKESLPTRDKTWQDKRE